MDILLKLSSIDIINKIVKYLPYRFSEKLRLEYKQYMCSNATYYHIPKYILPIELRSRNSFRMVLNELIWENFDGEFCVFHHSRYGAILYFEWDVNYIVLLDSIYAYCRTYDIEHEVVTLKREDYPDIESKFRVNLDTCFFHARKIGGCMFIIVGIDES